MISADGKMFSADGKKNFPSAEMFFPSAKMIFPVAEMFSADRKKFFPLAKMISADGEMFFPTAKNISPTQNQIYAILPQIAEKFFFRNTMFEGINEIDWKSLKHAYGDAEDIPGLLFDLQSADNQVRSNAYNQLFGNIWHQGTIYSATAYAVPFLFELLDSPLTKDKDYLITLLASIAAGQGYYQVHQTIFEQGNRNTDKHENELKQEEVDVKAVREAISPRFETLLKQLTNKEPEVRRSVAQAVSFYPEHKEKSLVKLQAALETETDEEIIVEIQESINRLMS